MDYEYIKLFACPYIPSKVRLGAHHSNLIQFGYYDPVQSTSIHFGLLSIQSILIYEVYIGLFWSTQSTSVQFGSLSLLVQFGILVHFGLIFIRSTSVYLVKFSPFYPFQSNSVHFSLSVHSSLIWSISIHLSTSVHFGLIGNLN